jgi:hypothetical protein
LILFSLSATILLVNADDFKIPAPDGESELARKHREEHEARIRQIIKELPEDKVPSLQPALTPEQNRALGDMRKAQSKAHHDAWTPSAFLDAIVGADLPKIKKMQIVDHVNFTTLPPTFFGKLPSDVQEAHLDKRISDLGRFVKGLKKEEAMKLWGVPLSHLYSVNLPPD